MLISFLKKLFPFNLRGSHTSSIKTPYLSYILAQISIFSSPLISLLLVVALLPKMLVHTTTITCVPNTQSRKYLQQPILPLCGIVYSKRLLRNEELFPLSLAFLKRSRSRNRTTHGRTTGCSHSWKKNQKKCYNSSLLDDAPNYLLGCVIQKEMDWHMILLFYFQPTLFCTIT